jgi:hypothetical protein
MARAWLRVPLLKLACTLVRMFQPSLLGSGLGRTVQAEPFQCSIRVCAGPPLASEPTAQTLHAEITVTPLRAFAEVPGFGGGTPVQLWQVSVDAAAGPAAADSPSISSGPATAQNLLGDELVQPFRTRDGSDGVELRLAILEGLTTTTS